MAELLSEEKEKIDNMPMSDMLAMWRFAPIGTFRVDEPWTEYFMKVMKEKKRINPEGFVQDSKELGWS